MSDLTEIEQLERAITALEAQRPALGDSVVDLALAPLRDKLASLRLEARPSRTGSPAAPGGAGLGEQRKTVTVLFCDLAGFTAISERMDPEDVREVLNVYFNRMTACIEAAGGSVEKFIGDAIMAVFGLRIAHEDDPESAVRAALVMRSALEDVNSDLQRLRGLQLAMRIGIHTGPVIVSFLGERKGQDFVVVGDTVNTASRLQTAAPVGGIAITHDTYRLVRGVFVVQPLPPLRVKGKAEPLQAYVVQRAKERSFRLMTRGVEGIETRLVGRDAELQRLKDNFSTAVENSERRVVTLVGEAGLGKSRLIYEFDNWVELLPETFLYFKGRARPSTQNVAFSMLRDLFSFRFKIQDSDPVPEACRKLVDGILSAWPPDERPDHAEAARAIGDMLGFDFSDHPAGGTSADSGKSPREQFERAMGFLTDYFSVLAARRPLVILLEDIHWADDSSLDVIQHLAGALQQRRVLIVCAARPSFFERRPQWGAGQSYHQRIDLHPLSRRDSRRLVGEILQKVEQVPETLRDLVVTNAEGNPFYMEELIKMLIEDGVIVKEGDPGGRWQVELGRLARVRVPTTLTGVLQARFDSLQPEERILLQRASVVGRTFWDQAVQAIGVLGAAAAPPAGGLDDLLHSLLTSLRQREMIYERGESAFQDTSEYLFKHALLRDVTYESVLKRERRIYHARTAHWLAQVTRRSRRGDEYAALIADHFDRAGETALAADWYRRAGLHAAAHYANAEAVRCLTQALELSPGIPPEEEYELLLARMRVNNLQGARQAEAQDLERLEALAGQLDDNRRRAEVCELRARLLNALSDYAGSAESARKALTLARLVADARIEAQSQLWWGGALWHRGEYQAARPPLEAALALARQEGLAMLECDCVRNLGVVMEALGDMAAAQEYFECAVELSERLGDKLGHSRALNSLGIFLYNTGVYDRSRQALEQSLNIRRSTGDRLGEASTLNNLGLLAYCTLNHQAARVYLEEALRISLEIEEMEGEASSLGNLGAVAIFQGDHAAARPWLERALLLYRQVGDQQGICEALANLCLLEHQQGNDRAALELGREAVRLAHETEGTSDEAHALLYLGQSLLGDGQVDAAAEAYGRALELRKELGQPGLFQEPLAGLARAALAAGDLPKALRYVDEILATRDSDDPLPNVHGADEPFRVYLTCFQVLQAAGGELQAEGRAASILEAAYHLLQASAAQVRDPALRKMFLENVPANCELAQAFLQPLGA